MTNVIELKFGKWFDAVFIDGDRLDPGASQRVFNHSPDGFAWGYGGSGPAQLALAILMRVTGDDKLSVALHQEFKREFLMGLPQGDARVEIDVAEWVEKARV